MDQERLKDLTGAVDRVNPDREETMTDKEKIALLRDYLLTLRQWIVESSLPDDEVQEKIEMIDENLRITEG